MGCANLVLLIVHIKMEIMKLDIKNNHEPELPNLTHKYLLIYNLEIMFKMHFMIYRKLTFLKI